MDIRDNEGWTALHAAASCGSVEIAQWVCVCFIHFIVISSWTGLAFGLNCAAWKSIIVSGISWTFNTISLNVVHGSGEFVSRFKTCKELGANFERLLFWCVNFEVWSTVLPCEILLGGISLQWNRFVRKESKFMIKLLFSRTQSLVSRKFYIKWPRLYEIPLKCCISGLRLMNQSCRFHNTFCNVLLCLVRKCTG